MSLFYMGYSPSQKVTEHHVIHGLCYVGFLLVDAFVTHRYPTAFTTYGTSKDLMSPA